MPMFEALIKRNIKAAGGFAENRQEATYRIKERQARVPDGFVPFNRAAVSPELSVDMTKGLAHVQDEPVIVFQEDSADTPPFKAERSTVPTLLQIARASAKMLAREVRRFDRMLTL